MPTQAVSFVVRLTLPGAESPAAWHGLIKHIQTGDERRFTDFPTAVAFMQHYLEQPGAGSAPAAPTTDIPRRGAEDAP